MVTNYKNRLRNSYERSMKMSQQVSKATVLLCLLLLSTLMTVSVASAQITQCEGRECEIVDVKDPIDAIPCDKLSSRSCEVTICGLKYLDENGNGVRDSGELGLSNWTIVIEMNRRSYPVTTGRDGRFCVTHKIEGETKARIWEIQQDGYEQTQPASPDGYQVILTTDVSYWFVFGNRPVSTEVCGTKFLDLDEDGVFEPNAGETGLPGWSIDLRLLDGNGVPTSTYTEVTDTNGNYCFTDDEYNLPAGVTAIVSEQWQETHHQTWPSNAPGTYSINLQDNTQFVGNDFGNDLGAPLCAIDAVLVLDRSGSMNGIPYANVLTGAQAFVNAMNTPWDQAGVVTFNGAATLDINLSWNLAAVAAGIPGLPNSGGGTAIDAGINMANAHLTDFNFRNPNAQPVMVVLSDGGSNAVAAQTAATNAQANGIQIITIAYNAGANAALLQSLASTANDFYVANNANIAQIYTNIANALCPTTGDISGQKFHDQNGNGVWGSSEPTLQGWMFTLLDANGIPVASDVSGADGTYSFPTVTPGTYTIVETGQPGWYQTFPASSGHTVIVNAGDNITGLDFGNTECRTCAEINGIKWNDLNGNGVQDGGEPLLGGFTFIIFDSNGDPVGTATSAADGTFTFPDLAADTYTIVEISLPGWVQTFPAGGGGHTVTVASGGVVTGVDFGNRECACGIISGYKWNDIDNDGVWDTNESALPGFTFLLSDDTGTPIATATSGPDGYYEFSDLEPGTYTVVEIITPGGGWTLTYPPTGQHVVTIGYGQHSEDNNFGNYLCRERCTIGGGSKLNTTLKAPDELSTKQVSKLVVSVQNGGKDTTTGTPAIVLPLATGLKVATKEWKDGGWSCVVTDGVVECTYGKQLESGEDSVITIPVQATGEAKTMLQCVQAGTLNDLTPQNNTDCAVIHVTRR